MAKQVTATVTVTESVSKELIMATQRPIIA